MAIPRRKEFRLLDPLRVRWAEIDAQRIVFNAHYLMYIDTAVGSYWRALAMPYQETMHALQGDTYVRKATLEYEASARYDDRLAVGIRCARVGTSSMQFITAVFRGEQCLVHGELIYVFADPATQTSKPVPPVLREALQAYEAGETMFTLRTGSWPEHGADSQALRQRVFVEDLRLPESLVADPADAQALHVLARNRFGTVVGTARLLPAQAGMARIANVATHPGARGAGVGQAMLTALLDAARARGDEAVVLDALGGTQPFYAAAGFAATGETFEAGGLPHVVMWRGL